MAGFSPAEMGKFGCLPSSELEAVAIAWVTLLAFIRISTNPRVFEQPLLAGEALAVTDAWGVFTHAFPTALMASTRCWSATSTAVASSPNF